LQYLGRSQKRDTNHDAGEHLIEIAEHIAAIEEEAILFAEAATHGGLDVGVPSCPDWDMRSLVRHLSEIHLWAGAHVACRTTKLWVESLDEIAAFWPDLAVFWPEDGELVDFYRATNGNLVRELRAAPADVAALSFLPAPSPLAMWARRQAHELAIHRVDAQQAIGSVTAFDADFAADGIDELLMGFAPRESTFPLADDRSMLVHATDTGSYWHTTMGPNGIDTAPEERPADVTLSGRAEDLYLSLWNRGDGGSLEVGGDHDVLATWHARFHIQWDL
jgi:uncharacterized protein (TIGR03083 family)